MAGTGKMGWLPRAGGFGFCWWLPLAPDLAIFSRSLREFIAPWFRERRGAGGTTVFLFGRGGGVFHRRPRVRVLRNPYGMGILHQTMALLLLATANPPTPRRKLVTTVRNLPAGLLPLLWRQAKNTGLGKRFSGLTGRTGLLSEAFFKPRAPRPIFRRGARVRLQTKRDPRVWDFSSSGTRGKFCPWKSSDRIGILRRLLFAVMELL